VNRLSKSLNMPLQLTAFVTFDLPSVVWQVCFVDK